MGSDGTAQGARLEMSGLAQRGNIPKHGAPKWIVRELQMAFPQWDGAPIECRECGILRRVGRADVPIDEG